MQLFKHKIIEQKEKKEKHANNSSNLRVHRRRWKVHNKNTLCWAFYCVNDGKDVDGLIFKL